MYRNSAVYALIVLVVVMFTAGPALAGPKDDILAGMRAAQNGDMEKAVKLFTKAIKSKKLSKENLAIAYTNRGSANDDMGQTDLAVLDYNRALKANPGYAMAYYNRSFAYEKKRMFDLALKDIQRAMAILPGDGDFQHREAYLKHKLGLK